MVRARRHDEYEASHLHEFNIARQLALLAINASRRAVKMVMALTHWPAY